jgi:hypothetical protein
MACSLYPMLWTGARLFGPRLRDLFPSNAAEACHD